MKNIYTKQSHVLCMAFLVKNTLFFHQISPNFTKKKPIYPHFTQGFSMFTRVWCSWLKKVPYILYTYIHLKRANKISVLYFLTIFFHQSTQTHGSTTIGVGKMLVK